MSSKERPSQGQDFGLIERERLFYRVSHERFVELFEADDVDVHRIELAHNSTGQFLFVTLSRKSDHARQPLTFYGLGYHDYRERWIHREWFWYEANRHSSTTTRIIPKDEARRLLEERIQEVAQHAAEDTQTKRGQLFEILADLTDEDGAIAEMDDLGSLLVSVQDPANSTTLL
ncbi:MAG: hypothetical protein CUN54_09315 [Phototrophicales bacterium]|nr:MAG: hypothetical protein CUN54_09315 [Phototrophicales bacterium]